MYEAGPEQTYEPLNPVISVERSTICPDLPAATVRRLSSSHEVKRDAVSY